MHYKQKHATIRLMLALFLAWLAFSLCASAAPPAQSTAARMQNVVRKFVQQTGQDVVGLGSWIRGGKYSDVLKIADAAKASDHDIRLLVPKGTSTEAALKSWQTGRRELIRLINEEFRQEAQKIMETVNFYAPNELMSAVEDAEDARRVFQRYDQVPNLGYHGAVTEKTPAKYVEGLYGEGAQAWTQSYERQVGRHFYNVNGKTFVSSTEYIHAVEGAGEIHFHGRGQHNAAMDRTCRRVPGIGPRQVAGTALPFSSPEAMTHVPSNFLLSLCASSAARTAPMQAAKSVKVRVSCMVLPPKEPFVRSPTTT